MKKLRRVQRADFVWLTAAALLVLLQFWWLPGVAESPQDSFSATVHGELGLYRVLQRLFPSVRREIDDLVPDSSATLLLLAPERYPTSREQERLHEFVFNGGVLIFAPNWSRQDLDLAPFGANLLGGNLVEVAEENSADASPGDPDPGSPALDPQEDPATPFPEVATAKQTTSDLVSGEIRWRTAAKLDLAYSDYEVLVQGPQGEAEAAMRAFGLGWFIICSSPDVFSNTAMLDQQQSLLAVRLIEAAHGRRWTVGWSDEIVFGEYLNASNSYRYTGVLLSPLFRSATLQLIVLAVLVGWFGFHRFGPALRRTSSERRRMTDCAQAVGNLQYRSSGSGAVVAGYLDYLQGQLRRHYGTAVSLNDTAAIASRTGIDAHEIAEQVAKANSMVHSKNVPAGTAAAMVRWLAQLRFRLVQKTDA